MARAKRIAECAGDPWAIEGATDADHAIRGFDACARSSRRIKLLGGKCARCEWSGLPAGYDFHHVSGEKDFNIGQVSHKSWAVVKRELQKCELLCRVCHAIEHSKHDDEKLMAEVAIYQGSILPV